MAAVQQPSLFSYHREVIPTVGARQAQVLDVLRRQGEMTNSELPAALGW